MSENPRFHESWEPLIQGHAARPEASASREVLQKTVGEQIERARKAPAMSNVQLSAGSSGQDVHPKEAELKGLQESKQVAFLAHLAMEEGIEPAVRLAEKLNSPYVVDAFHDLIVDRLLNEITQRQQKKE